MTSRWSFFSDLPRDDRDECRELDFPADQSVEADLDRAERRALVEQALQSLPAPQRVPLVLFHFEQMSYDEIAARLGASASKVKTDIHRGRLALKRKLELIP